MQSVLLIWLDNNIDNNGLNSDSRDTLKQLRQEINDIEKFTNIDRCIDFLTDIHDQQIFIFISGSLCENIISLIHDITQLHAIFIFCSDKVYHEQWVKDWSKISGVFTEISSVCEALKQVTQQCEQNTMSISFIATGDENISKKNLDQLDPIFMYSQILKEILLTIEFDDTHIKKFLEHCRGIFVGNDVQLSKIDRLQKEYHTKTPIWWYTWESFLYPMLNRGLRVMDTDIIINMGFFITDVHRQIKGLHLEQFTSDNSKQIFTVYRGQGMSITDFAQMKNTRGGLMSFNSFLSTSKDRQVSFRFANRALKNIDMIGILFVITIDTVKSTTPFASIVDVGFYGNKEDEVLFSMHTVFRIGEITSMNENSRLFQVNLTLTSDDDIDLRVLTDFIREETYPNSIGWYRLGLLLIKIGESAKAQQVFEILLSQATDMGKKAELFHLLGWTKSMQGEYKEEMALHKKAMEIVEKILSPTDLNLAGSYNYIGGSYFSMGDYQRALSYYEKALEIKKQSPPSNDLDLAYTYNNIGIVYESMSDYSKALSFYEKTLEIKKQSLPSNHPDLGNIYNDIGNLYVNMGEYPRALSFYEKALEVQKQSLPSNHPGLAKSYNNIGAVYKNMVDYTKALSFYEKALEIQKQSLPSNHPHTAWSYNNIGAVYSKMGDYAKALSLYEQALKMREESLPSNHPDLAHTYNNIGNVYLYMRDYRRALSYHEKALEIKKQSLPSDHPDLADTYSNVGVAYLKMGDYSKAHSCCERAVKIAQHSLPNDHPNLQGYKRNLDAVKKKL